MTDHIATREKILNTLRRELVGPDPIGEPLDCSHAVTFATREESYPPRTHAGTGEEILQRDRPSKRYGVGVLYPIGRQEDAPGDETDTTSSPPSPSVLDNDAKKEVEVMEDRGRDRSARDTDDLDLSLANSYQPSTMGVTFFGCLPVGATLVVDVTAARYHPFKVTVAGKDRTWWVRTPFRLRAEFDGAQLVTQSRKLLKPTVRNGEGDLNGVSVEVVTRPAPAGPLADCSRSAIVTVCLVNRQEISASDDEACFFQCTLAAAIESPEASSQILPYPGPPMEQLDDEEKEIDLLYRKVRTFAVGHGCAAGWTNSGPDRAERVLGECLPTFETPSITPDILRKDGSRIEVDMAVLAGLVEGDDGFGALQEIVTGYVDWIALQRLNARGLRENHHRNAADRHLQECDRVAERMQAGIDYLRKDPIALDAFRLANYAMVLQRARNPVRTPRARVFNDKVEKWEMSEPYPKVEEGQALIGTSKWRPFQVAFMLMSLRSTAVANDPDRERVELIWFPTGGGKTEAYLGLAAFSLFLRRLRGVAARHPNDDAGVHVIMRYTLRLLTAQQFQRAAALIAAMEYLRRQTPRLGTHPFVIGIWVGGTPNDRQQACAAIRALRKGEHDPQHNIVVLERCPWCRAQLGRHKTKIDKQFTVHGYVEQARGGGTTVAARCSDPACIFADRLPVEFVDEDIYDANVPAVSMVIGTVDKFAMLAWRPEARRLFGRDRQGRQVVAPPGLILQDELHLIAGPIGSMVGLYETVIEELCIDRQQRAAGRPKIVTSTATIRSYRDQVHKLFDRSKVTLFPPPALDAEDSYFAHHARDERTNHLQRGRMYVGVHAPGLGSAQTVQVRTFSALLQAPVGFGSTARDPWWTLLLFYNSIRELGGALTLFQSDIPDYLQAIRSRHGIDFKALRRIHRLRELTGRLADDEVTTAISELEVETDSKKGDAPVDACLASNIIEVGVDIDRLSLMAVVGQPKTTAQYIQVTGRIGRRWWERPGVVVTLYGASKPRDRSHFEKFRTYHERLYAQVEPTSLTPFSRPALDRALHGVLAAYARQIGDQAVAGSPYPYPSSLIAAVSELLERRVASIDPDEASTLEALLARRIEEWNRWQPNRWDDRGRANQDVPLLRWPAAYASAAEAARSWATPTSMRNVDAECEVRITGLYGGPAPSAAAGKVPNGGET